MKGRPAKSPGSHWPDRAEVIGGLDVEAGGTWMAINPSGVFATLLNAKYSLGPEPGKRSRGELPLDALDFEAAADAAEALATLEPSAYRAFNLLIIDSDAAFLLQNNGKDTIQSQRIAPGLHMISHSDLDDPSDPRVRWFKDAFARTPKPENPTHLKDWRPWVSLMASTQGEDPSNPLTALTITTDMGFQTRCTALIALNQEGKAVWWHGEGQLEEGQSGEDQLGDNKLSHFHNISI